MRVDGIHDECPRAGRVTGSKQLLGAPAINASAVRIQARNVLSFCEAEAVVRLVPSTVDPTRPA